MGYQSQADICRIITIAGRAVPRQRRRKTARGRSLEAAQKKCRHSATKDPMPGLETTRRPQFFCRTASLKSSSAFA